MEVYLSVTCIYKPLWFSQPHKQQRKKIFFWNHLKRRYSHWGHLLNYLGLQDHIKSLLFHSPSSVTVLNAYFKEMTESTWLGWCKCMKISLCKLKTKFITDLKVVSWYLTSDSRLPPVHLANSNETHPLGWEIQHSSTPYYCPMGMGWREQIEGCYFPSCTTSESGGIL